MAYRHPRSKVLSVLAVITMVAAIFLVGGIQADYQAEAAGVPPAFAQGFSEIVKAVTPAVVNIAVTGGGEAVVKAVVKFLPAAHSVVHLPLLVTSHQAWNHRALPARLLAPRRRPASSGPKCRIGRGS